MPTLTSVGLWDISGLSITTPAALAVAFSGRDNGCPFTVRVCCQTSTREMDEAILTKIATAEDETADLDFKSAFDPASTRDWCELVKDIVAFANSGGGCIVFGVNDDGSLPERT